MRPNPAGHTPVGTSSVTSFVGTSATSGSGVSSIPAIASTSRDGLLRPTSRQLTESACRQTESGQFKLDGLVLVIKASARPKANGKLTLQALGVVSFDDETGTYRMRAFDDGRWLETEVTLVDRGNSISWGFALGEFKATTVLRINEKGEWTELGELVIGD